MARPIHTRRHVMGFNPALLRPPWSDESSVRNGCTSCGACIAACPEGILVAGPARTPVVQFNGGACTFCRECVSACDEPVFKSTDQPAWPYIATIGDTCLQTKGVACQSCTDACDDDALCFDYQSGFSGGITVRTDNCTGCGACIGICPTAAITLDIPRTEAPQ